MARVYLVRADGCAGIHRFLAVKVMHPHLSADPAFVAMFFDEANIATQVRHANVCSVFHCDVAGGHYYLAMEYLMGEPLLAIARNSARRLRENPRRHALYVGKLIADACEGLHAVHELRNDKGKPLNVVHRDISPDNIFLTYDGVAKVVDFGLASAVTQRHHTRTGIVKGKFAYLAPEVLKGERADRRADVWALGIVLWELLTGKRLFYRQSELDTLKAIAEAPIEAPSQVRRGIPKEFDNVVMKALARDRERRHASARELGRALLKVLAQQNTALGFADLSEWMDEIFPKGRARQRALLAEAACQSEAGDDEEEPTRMLAIAGSNLGTGSMTRCSQPQKTETETGTTTRFDWLRCRPGWFYASIAACVGLGGGIAYQRADIATLRAALPGTNQERTETSQVKAQATELGSLPTKVEPEGRVSANRVRLVRDGSYVIELLPDEQSSSGIMLRLRTTEPTPPPAQPLPDTPESVGVSRK